MSAAATAAGFLFASRRIGKRADPCTKTQYETVAAAEGEAKRMRGEGAPRLRAYGCWRCNKWHVSSWARG